MSWIKRLFCRHTFAWQRNIYGDEIVFNDWKRSVWRCANCGKWEARDDLHYPEFDL